MTRSLTLIALLTLFLPHVIPAHTFYVTNTKDDDEGSFRWAVEMCDWYQGACDTVLFAIPTRDPGYDPEIGVWTIRRDTLPNHEPYTFRFDCALVDGFSQRRFIGMDTNPLGPEIELEGPSQYGYNRNGIRIVANDITVRGLCINGFTREGINITSWPSTEITERAVVAGCYINVDPTGARRVDTPTDGMVVFHSQGLRIGGDAPEESNIISGAGREISIDRSGGFAIVNNIIGTDRSGVTDLAPNRHANLYITHVTSPSVVRDNIIAGDAWNNVDLAWVMTDSGSVSFINNRIGVGLDGSPIGAQRSIVVNCTPGHLFKWNIIANAHAWNGIDIRGFNTDYVTISQNSIYGCNRLGIELGNDHNCTLQMVDYIDGVYGPGVNEEIDACLCDSVVNSDAAGGGTTTVYLTCMPDCIIEVFEGDTLGWRPRCSESGYGRVYSGITYLGNADEVEVGPVWSTYRFSISPALPDGTILTSTATNQNGSTSEFGCTCRVGEVGTTEEGCLPSTYRFLPPAPNPCLHGTTLSYHLPEAAHVRIVAYDMAGKQVATIRDERQEHGIHAIWWEARGMDNSPLPNGTYVIRMVTDHFVASAKVTVLR